MGEILSSKAIGAKVREFRKFNGLTQEQLAVLTGVSFQQIQQYESGQTRMNTDKLQTVAQALAIPVGALFDHYQPISPEEGQLLKEFRAVSSPEVRAFIVKGLEWVRVEEEKE